MCLYGKRLATKGVRKEVVPWKTRNEDSLRLREHNGEPGKWSTVVFPLSLEVGDNTHINNTTQGPHW